MPSGRACIARCHTPQPVQVGLQHSGPLECKESTSSNRSLRCAYLQAVESVVGLFALCLALTIILILALWVGEGGERA